MQLSINTHHRLLDLSLPRVMAIVNVTPDSFYTSCGNMDEESLLQHVEILLKQGADIIDIGACSTRPGSIPIGIQEEWTRLFPAIRCIRTHFPNTILSVDTFRAEIAQNAIHHGVDIINDVYGGNADNKMWDVIAAYKIPYILTYAQEIPKSFGPYDYTISHMLDFMQSQLNQLYQKGIADVIIDPGFGFGKTEQQNYTILKGMDVLSSLHVPTLVGLSRKSMLYKPLGIGPLDVLPATIAANTLALERGANILRVHDVVAAKQAIDIYTLTCK